MKKNIKEVELYNIINYQISLHRKYKWKNWPKSDSSLNEIKAIVHQEEETNKIQLWIDI